MARTSSSRTEEPRCGGVLGCLSIVKSFPILFSMFHQCFPGFESFGNLLILAIVQDEYVLALNSCSVRSFQCVLQDLRFYDQELGACCFDGMIQLIWLVGWVRSGKYSSKCNNPADQYWVVDLPREISQALSTVHQLQPTSLKECMQTTSPFLSPTSLKPAASFRIVLFACPWV